MENGGLYLKYLAVTGPHRHWRQKDYRQPFLMQGNIIKNEIKQTTLLLMRYESKLPSQ